MTLAERRVAPAAPALRDAARPWAPDRLGRRQVRYTLVLIVLVGLVVGLLQIAQDVRQERARMARVGEGVTTLIEAAAARAAYTFDQALAAAVVASLLELDTVSRVVLEDHLGRPLAFGERPRAAAPLRPLTDALFGERLVYRQSLSAPPDLPAGGAPIGALAIEFDTRQLADDLIGRSAWLLGLGMAKTAILGLALTGLFLLTVTRPLARLAGDVEAISPEDPAEGVLSVAPSHAHDELGRLAGAVNDLLARFRGAARERRRADALREDSERRFRAAADNMPDGLAVIEPDDSLSFFNAQFVRNTHERVRPLLALGRSFEGCLREAAEAGPIYHPEMGEDFLERNLAGYAAGERDVTLRLADGRTIRVRARRTPGGGRLLLTTDVTERRRLAEELARAEKLSAVGTLAGGVAHDFNNLLAIMFSATEVALAHQPPDGPARAPLQRVLAAGRRGRQLVEQVMTFSRAERAPREVIDLGDSVGRALALCRPLFEDGARVVFERAEGPLPIAASDTHIHQLIANLCQNAAQAAPNGTVRVAVAHAGNEARLSVADDGPGIDAATRARVFEPFFTTKQVGRGAGLGLAVVYGVVDALGGQVNVASPPGAGAVFTVSLPMVSPG